MVRTKALSALSLVFIPAIYIISYTRIGDQKGPFWWTPNQDPDYAYLLNSLLIANLQVPGHIDHPGTTLQILGGLVIRVSYFIQSWFNPDLGTVTDAVLNNPELYLYLINYTLIVLTGLAFLLVGFIAFKLCQNLLISLILQLTPFIGIQTIVIDEPSRVAPENLLFCISQFLVVLLLFFLFSKNVEKKIWFAVSFGILLGIGIATKVTFVPIALFGLLISGTARKAIAIIIAAVSLLIATSPVMVQYSRIINWLIAVAVHTGPYETGERGVIEPAIFFDNLSRLELGRSLFFKLVLVVTAAFLAALIVVGKSRRESLPSSESLQIRRLFFVSGLVLFVTYSQILVAATENAHPRYLIPAISLSGLLVVLLVYLCNVVLQRIKPMRNSISRLALVALVVSAVISIDELLDAATIAQERYNIRQKDLATIQQLVYDNPEYRSCVTTYAKRGSSREAALYVGNIWTGMRYSGPESRRFSNELMQIYPEAIFYYNEQITGNEVFESFNQQLDAQEIFDRGQGCVLLLTMPLNERNKPRSFDIEDIFVGETTEVYRLYSPS